MVVSPSIPGPTVFRRLHCSLCTANEARSNNFAELWAVGMALSFLLDSWHNRPTIYILSDSKFIIDLLNRLSFSVDFEHLISNVLTLKDAYIPPANRRSGSAGCLVIPALLATRSPTRWPTLAVVQPAHCHLLLPRMAPASSTTSTPTPPLPNPYQPRSPTWTGLTCIQISTQLTLPTTPGSAHIGSHLVYPSLLNFPFTYVMRTN